MSGLNIVFAGTPEFGLPCLEAISQSPHHLKAIYSQPDRPAGRGRKLQASAIKQWALAHDIPVYQPLNFKSSSIVDGLASLTPDVMVVIAYGLILPKAVLEIPRLGCINVHASLLPRWRGASPIQHAILHGDSESGVTIMQMDAGMDTGAMLSQVICPVNSTDTTTHLHDKLAELSAKPLLHVLEKLQQNKSRAEKQQDGLATYAGKISKEDALINWQNPAITVDRQIRAFNPWPIAYTLLGDEVLRVHQARVIDTETNEKAGTILSLSKTGILIATGSKILQVEKIQFPGANTISVIDWLNAGKSQLYAGLVL